MTKEMSEYEKETKGASRKQRSGGSVSIMDSSSTKSALMDRTLVWDPGAVFRKDSLCTGIMICFC